MRLGFRLHDEHDHSELDGRTGHDFRLWLNVHMMKNHLERPSLKGTEAKARERHSALHAEMAKRAAEWAASHEIDFLVPETLEAKRFERTMKPLRAKDAATGKKNPKKPKKSNATKVSLRKSVKGSKPRIRVVSGGAPGLGKRR